MISRRWPDAALSREKSSREEHSPGAAPTRGDVGGRASPLWEAGGGATLSAAARSPDDGLSAPLMA